jgi:hypothetical protein
MTSELSELATAPPVESVSAGGCREHFRRLRHNKQLPKPVIRQVGPIAENDRFSTLSLMRMKPIR